MLESKLTFASGKCEFWYEPVEHAHFDAKLIRKLLCDLESLSFSWKNYGFMCENISENIDLFEKSHSSYFEIWNTSLQEDRIK